MLLSRKKKKKEFSNRSWRVTNGHCVTARFPSAEAERLALRQHSTATPVALGQEQADGICGGSARKQLEARIKE